MIVYYRLAGHKSSLSKPSPILKDNLLALHTLCMQSFVKALEEVKPKMVFLLDYCNEDYDRMIESLVPFEKEVRHTAFGINETCLLQYTLYERSNEDKVLFQEGDYLFVPKTGKEIEQALDTLPFLSPYDHPDKYETEKEPYVKVVNGRHWKQTISTTATFATRREHFLKYKDSFYKWGYLDHKRWVEIADNGGTLFTPLPSIATHMVEDFMAPHINWGALLQTS